MDLLIDDAADPDPSGVSLRIDGACALLTLERPEKANAMDRQARRALLDRLSEAQDCRVVIVTGAGRHFCSGIDLKERDRDMAEGDHSAFGEWAEVILAVRQHPAVFIAAVNGTALGGGLTLVNGCDLALAAEDATFGMPELGFGVYPALAGPSTQITLSRKRAAWMILTTDRVGAAEALGWGLINRVTSREVLLQDAVTLGRRIAGFDADAITASKRALDLIPSAISDWRQAFAYGDLANAGIRAASTRASKPAAPRSTTDIDKTREPG